MNGRPVRLSATAVLSRLPNQAAAGGPRASEILKCAARYDFDFYDYGAGIAILTPLTDRARTWCSWCLADDHPSNGNGFLIEPRRRVDIVDSILQHGYTLLGEAMVREDANAATP